MKEENKEVIEIEDIKELKDIVENLPEDAIVSIVDEKDKKAMAIVSDENLSLAIGKKGMNVKLASRLTKYNIDVKTMEQINNEANKD